MKIYVIVAALGAVLGAGLGYRFRRAAEQAVSVVAGMIRRIRGNPAP